MPNTATPSPLPTPSILWVWITSLLAALLPATASPAHAQTSPTTRAPNFIFIITDDQRFDALGVVQREQGNTARFPFFQTPNMDRLAAGGIRFRNAFVVHSLCSPSRATFLTGRYTHQHNIRANNQPFNSTQTWAGALATAGYSTGYFGKWHMGKQLDRPGFQTTYTFLDQGNYDNCVMYENGTQVESNGWVDDVITDHALKFIEAHAAANPAANATPQSTAPPKPFGIVIGYKSPHDPRKPPARHANLYADVTIQPPANASAIPPFRKPDQIKQWNPTSVDRLNYFRCLTAIDDNIGRLLDLLDKTKLADDTVIVFVGDNGYYLGEHSLGDKRSAYEDSIRIPFLVRYPRLIKPNTLSDALILNADLAPTILSLAKLPPLPNTVGRDLSPLFTTPTPASPSTPPSPTWRSSFLYQNFKDPEYPEVTFDIYAVRTNTAKLVVYPDNPSWTEVYDLQNDPLEMKNLAQDPSAQPLRDTLWSEFHRHTKETHLDLSTTWLAPKP